jgi:hypothetical protein
MAILGFTGQMPVAISIVWKGDLVPNAVTGTRKDVRMVLANESLTELTVKALMGGSLRLLERKATAKKRLYDDKLNLYVTEPIASSVVEEFLALARGAKVNLDMTFTFNTFFEALAAQMTRTDADLRNLANANANESKAILSTFKHSASGGNVSIQYNAATQKLAAQQAQLVDSSVKMPPGGKVPAVKLVFEIDFGAAPSDKQKEIMRKLIAMDWSKLARFGKPGTARQDVVIWANNVFIYLCNHTDIARGERFRQAIQGRHVGKTPLQLSVDLRVDLDAHLVTANHWGQAREDMKTETHQRLLSDLFGTLHQATFLSSPVFFLREISKRILLSDTDKDAALSLQYGVGHCGEHAGCSFSILRGIMKSPGNKVSAAIFSGNANIDHAFVVYNLVPDSFTTTKATNPKNTRVDVDAVISVFDLKDAISRNPLGSGFVMDPYLDKTAMKATAGELLTSLNSAKRAKQGKDTDFLAFDEIHLPALVKPPTEIDITSKTPAERKALVKNV